MSTTRLTKQSMCPLDCPDACRLEVTVEEGRVTGIDADPREAFTGRFICGKVRDYADHVYHPERLTQPLMRRVGSSKGEADFERVSWEEALERVAQVLMATRKRSGGEAILPFSYGGSNGKLTQDTTDLALFRRLGASRLLQTVCAAATTAVSRGMYGGMPGVALEDYEHARMIVVWGANPAASGIHLVPVIERARERGAKLVVVDPRRTKLARRADMHFALRPGTDVVLAGSVLRELFESGAADSAFLKEHANGARELRERVQAFTLERAGEVCGVDPVQVKRFAELYAASDPAVVRCGWGLERNRNGGSSVAAVLALPAVAGKFGRRGGGFTLSQSGQHRFESPFSDPEPATRAVNMNRLGRALLEPEGTPIEALFVYNANPLATLPQQELVRRGLEREDLFTVVFDQVMTDTARYADVVLPATTFLEHAELRAGYGSLAMHYAQPAIEPVGAARTNSDVFADLLQRVGLAREDDPLTIEALLSSTLGDSERLERLRAGEAVAPDCGMHPVQFEDVWPATPEGRIELVPSALDREAPRGLYGYREDPGDAAHPLALVSPATSQTISSSLGELVNRPATLGMHSADAAARGLADGELVRVFNTLGEVHTQLRIDSNLRPGVCELVKGLWLRHTRNARTSNALVPDTLTDVAGGACFNDARVEVERLAHPA